MTLVEQFRAGWRLAMLGAWLLAAGPGLGQTLPLPPRPPQALSGTELIRVLTRLPLVERENWIYAQVTSGNVPDFLRTLVPIAVTGMVLGTPHSLTYYAAPDYLAVGSDTDYFLVPMTPLPAQRLCAQLGCTLPTRKMVNQIWTNAAVKLAPRPIPPSPEMITVPVFAQHNYIVWTNRSPLTNVFPLGSLVSGDKKDVVLSTLIYSNLHSGVPKPVVIYGWHYQSGDPIQPLYNGHEETYADYSHGVRLVQNAILLDGQPNTVTNVLTHANLAGLLSDEGANEATTNGVVALPRYSATAQAPVLLTHPRSQTVRAGNSAAFKALAVGTEPLTYRWQLNGTNLTTSGAGLDLTNVEPSQAGVYTVQVTNLAGAATSRPALLRFETNANAVLFADDFEADSSANWNLFWGAADGIPDYTVDWAFDYHATPFTFNGVTGLVPPAPNSADGRTRAVRLTVNNNDLNPATAGVNLYPRGQYFSGDFALKFDLWLNYPGNAGGLNSTGSTQHAIFGLNHTGTRVNWAAPAAPASDGVWFAMDGEGGTSSDYRAYVGNPAGTPIDLTASGASGLSASNNAAAIFQTLFPATRFETAGAPGKNWVEVELRQTNQTIFWWLDGFELAQRANASPFTAGDLMLGLMDTFSSIANPAEDSFALFANVRVEALDGRVRFLSARVLEDETVRLVLATAPGRNYSLETSTNLVDWTSLGLLTGSNAPVSFVDPNPASDRRFYRTPPIISLVKKNTF